MSDVNITKINNGNDSINRKIIDGGKTGNLNKFGWESKSGPRR
ncbi:hypothetical protein [Methanosarcina sp. DH1]|nr:hypothetical protein [Methanosarcina sp. DH1]